jgi:hypothetical protein
LSSSRPTIEKSNGPASFYKPNLFNLKQDSETNLRLSSKSKSSNPLQGFTAKSQKSITIQDPKDQQYSPRESIVEPPSLLDDHESLQPDSEVNVYAKSVQSSKPNSSKQSRQPSIFGQFRSDSFKSIKSSKTPASNHAKLSPSNSQRDLEIPRSTKSGASMEELDPEIIGIDEEKAPLNHTPSNLEF